MLLPPASPHFQNAFSVLECVYIKSEGESDFPMVLYAPCASQHTLGLGEYRNHHIGTHSTADLRSTKEGVGVLLVILKSITGRARSMQGGNIRVLG